MSELDEEQLDAMLHGFYAKSLDPQHGRAEWSFRRYLKDTAQSAWRLRTRLVGAFVTGMAASIAIVWAAPLFRAATPAPDTSFVTKDPTTPSTTVVPPVVRVVQSHTIDQGIMLFGDDTPIRVIRRQQLKQTQWLDGGQHVQAEQTTPQDELLFIKMPTY